MNGLRVEGGVNLAPSTTGHTLATHWLPIQLTDGILGISSDLYSELKASKGKLPNCLDLDIRRRRAFIADSAIAVAVLVI